MSLFKGIKDAQDNYIEIFKNPTEKELNDTYNKEKELRNYYYLRGILKQNGDIYVWPGSYLHCVIEQHTGIDGMKFVYSPKDNDQKWEIELVDGRLEFEEIMEYLNKYMDKLKTIGDTTELEDMDND